ncbi:hypothetical protein PHLGIDRAFT_25918 [Phlebiopsis gigantea 11061_1 CR5-6]|uniref:Uncharacterized protein n=1 Tax=Phlebiopsis gigantea (strain 11061_1 CR5-6) TaxID=745531 RepID=A0A0C3NGI1_PHLG1|nr:hypothetical protein PHLGIDRAFT_25918 [Phlebiopsis gigantea 11061_1 CR5-6]
MRGVDEDESPPPSTLPFVALWRSQQSTPLRAIMCAASFRQRHSSSATPSLVPSSQPHNPAPPRLRARVPPRSLARPARRKA